MIDIRELTVQFGGIKPINGLSVQLKAPIVGLIGPNGAGKTTLLNVLSGFVTPTAGDVFVNDVSLRGIAPHRRAQRPGIRRTFQTDQIADDLTLFQNVQVVADRAGFSRSAEAQKAIERSLSYVGLLGRADARGTELSTQERHLGEIAKAIVGQPKLVMLDEPGAGMSEQETAHLERVIRGIPEYCGAQVFLIDHDVALISACCEETLVLDFGRLLALGPTHRVLDDPEVRRAYLGELIES